MKYSDVEKVVLEKWYLHLRSLIATEVFGSSTNLKLSLNDMFQAVELKFQKYIASQRLDEVSATYPRDWLEAFKERWFPMWLRTLYPVRYITVKLEARALYPKIKLPNETHQIVMLKQQTRAWFESED